MNDIQNDHAMRYAQGLVAQQIAGHGVLNAHAKQGNLKRMLEKARNVAAVIVTASLFMVSGAGSFVAGTALLSAMPTAAHAQEMYGTSNGGWATSSATQDRQLSTQSAAQVRMDQRYAAAEEAREQRAYDAQVRKFQRDQERIERDQDRAQEKAERNQARAQEKAERDQARAEAASNKKLGSFAETMVHQLSYDTGANYSQARAAGKLAKSVTGKMTDKATGGSRQDAMMEYSELGVNAVGAFQSGKKGAGSTFLGSALGALVGGVIYELSGPKEAEPAAAAQAPVRGYQQTSSAHRTQQENSQFVDVVFPGVVGQVIAANQMKVVTPGSQTMEFTPAALRTREGQAVDQAANAMAAWMAGMANQNKLLELVQAARSDPKTNQATLGQASTMMTKLDADGRQDVKVMVDKLNYTSSLGVDTTPLWQAVAKASNQYQKDAQVIMGIDPARLASNARP